jgi:hypothetical protein
VHAPRQSGKTTSLAAVARDLNAEGRHLAVVFSQGQPWLVNALAAEVVSEMGVAPPDLVTEAHVVEAKERLILARATHLDYLSTRLDEPRVQRVLEPLLLGDLLPNRDPVYDDDIAYIADLGLIAPGNPIRVANPIYKEVIVRVLTAGIEGSVTVEPRNFLLPDGRIDLGKVLDGFAGFWAEHGEFLTQGGGYNEFAAQLVFMAYLQRVVNGGGHVDREYGDPAGAGSTCWCASPTPAPTAGRPCNGKRSSCSCAARAGATR